MSKYGDIIERLEKADRPNFQLEADIHQACTGGEDTWNRIAPAYTASLDAAIALTERLLPGCDYTVNGGRNEQNASIVVGGFGEDIIFKSSRSKEATPAIALLIATFRALEAQEGK